VASDNLETAKASQEAFLARDFEGFLDCFTDDVDWDPGAFLTGSSSYPSKEGLRQWLGELEDMAEKGERMVAEIVENREVDDGRVVGLGRSRLTREAGDLEWDWAAVYAFRDGKIASMKGFTSHAEGLAEVGLEA
jgi:ketosteroid isomerase-like protein